MEYARTDFKIYIYALLEKLSQTRINLDLRNHDQLCAAISYKDQALLSKE